VLDRLVGTGRVVRGELRPVREQHGAGPGGLEYCDADVLRRLRRASLARLRAEVEPVEPAALGRFLPSWHGIGARIRRAPGPEDVLSVVEQLAARRSRPARWSRWCCPPGCPATTRRCWTS